MGPRRIDGARFQWSGERGQGPGGHGSRPWPTVGNPRTAVRDATGYSGMQLQALDLLTRSKVKSAFDVNQESPELRARYGEYLFGSSTLSCPSP